MTDVDRMIRVYRKIREKRTALKKAYDAEDKVLSKQLATLDAEFQRLLSSTNSKSIKTDEGTVFTKVDTKVSIADSGTFMSWVRDNDAMEMLQKRVTTKEVVEYINEHGEAPPGLTIYREHKVQVRKS